MNIHFELPQMDYPAAVAIGMFDGLHLGHRQVIQNMQHTAAEKGLQSLVFSFRNHPLSILFPDRMPRLITTYQEKIHLLEQMGVETCVLIEFTPELAQFAPTAFVQEILKDRLQAGHVTVGYNFSFGYQAAGKTDLLQSMGAELGFGVTIIPPFTHADQPVTSSRIRQLMAAGAFAEALKLLAGSFVIGGQVVQGQGIAAKLLGVPTANIACNSPDKLLPPRGVYLCRVRLPHDTRPAFGVVNIGNRPTFGGQELSIEVYILDFTGILYGEYLEIALLEHLRPEQKFDRVEALKEQIQLDIAQARIRSQRLEPR